MKLLDSLLDAIVRLEGDALVMHVGEKPYVVTASASMNAYRGPLAWGQVELSSRVLTFPAVMGMLGQILPPEEQRALEEFGAVEHEIPAPAGLTDRFTVVAARGGEDIWLEVRRRPIPEPREVPMEVPAAAVTPEPAHAHHEPIADTPTVVAPAGEAEMEPAAADGVAHVPVQDASEAPVPLEQVVVTMPGAQDEIPLAEVSEDAIQVIDDEPQGVPTDEEVDAMLASTGAALLTPSLVELDERVDVAPEPSFRSETVAAETEMVAAQSEPAAAPPEAVVQREPEPVIASPVIVPPTIDAFVKVEPEPGFELSPPSETPIAEAQEDTDEVAELRPEAVTGAPLFDEAAIRAAAPRPPVDHGVPPEFAVTVADAVDEPAADDRSIVAPSSIEIAPEVLARDLEPSLPVSEIPELPQLNVGAEPAVSEETSRAEAPTPPEMHMDVTRDPQKAEAAAGARQSSPMSSSDDGDTAAAQIPADTDAMRPGVVVPLVRTPIKPEPVPVTLAEDAAVIHTLQIAAARGASTVYVVAQSKPLLRVDGEISVLEGEPVLMAADVERLVMELAPPRRRDALQNGPVEWLCDVPEIGRVRCLTFRDHRGPGVIFRMFPPRAISADQLGLTPEVQALCAQSDGLVLVAGGRASGKSTLMNAFVDLINRTRSDHVITIESQIGFVHESRKSFISQRETRGDAETAAAAVRSALREDPDVLVIEDLRSADIVAAALEAAESGRLVFGSVPASSTIAALERVIEVFPGERRAKARATLAASLRGVVAQVLLRRVKGGRVAAREVLLNTPAVATLVLEGKTFQLPVALDSGRRHGMVPLTDSLAAHVREGTVHAAEAYRKAIDRAALLAHLKREGVDTSFAERLA